MKFLPCELVQDLLPLYHDGVCSDTSRKLVDSHLETCEKCTQGLKGMAEDIELPKLHADEAFQDIHNHGNQSSFLAKGTKHIGCTGIAAAGLLNVNPVHFSQDDCRGNIAQEICNYDCQNSRNRNPGSICNKKQFNHYSNYSPFSLKTNFREVPMKP